MNNKKIINYLMMQTLEATYKGLEILDDYNLEDDVLLRVQLSNIEHYARMIIEKDGAI